MSSRPISDPDKYYRRLIREMGQEKGKAKAIRNLSRRPISETPSLIKAVIHEINELKKRIRS